MRFALMIEPQQDVAWPGSFMIATGIPNASAMSKILTPPLRPLLGTIITRVRSDYASCLATGSSGP